MLGCEGQQGRRKGPCSAAKGSGRRAYRCPAVMDGGRRTTFYSIVRLRSGFRVPAPVRIPARVWAVASGEATAFRAVIGLEVTGWRVVAVRRGCRRRRRREDRRTGRGGRKRLRAAEVRLQSGSSPASVGVPARVWARVRVAVPGPNCRTAGKRLRDARSKAGGGGGGENGVPAKLRDGQAGRVRRAKDGAGEGDGYNEKAHRHATVGFLSDRLCLIRLRLPRT